MALFAKAEVPVLRSLLSDPSLPEREGIAWTPTDFKDQEGALGRESDSFKPGPQLRDAVEFWVKVYTEYRSDQGIIHDLENLNVIYEKVDFSSINNDSSMAEGEKAMARENLLEGRKKAISQSLAKLATDEKNDDLTDFDKSILEVWENQGGISALKEAAENGSLRFQLGQSDRIKEAIYLSGRYLPMMERVFRESGLPIELTRLVFVESSFNVMARSKVGASGLWQIMPSAARGRLKMNKVVDLRNHPREATEFAAKMLKFNFNMLQSWPLAITGYNHGPYGVRRLVEKYGTRDLVELIKNGEGRTFGFASRNFFASFLAALEVETHASQYFPGIRRAPELKFENLPLKRQILFSDLVKIFDGDREQAILFNPHLSRLALSGKVRLDGKIQLAVPAGKLKKAEKILATLNGPEIQEVKAKTSKKRETKVRSLASPGVEQSRIYRVLKGDTLFRIARQFGVRVSDILSLNELKGPGSIRAGQVLTLPH